MFGGSPPVASVADRVVQIAKKENAPIGYADYWDAASLTWSTNFAARVYPVVHCVHGSDALCPYWFNIVSTWYDPRTSKSFVLRDSKSLDMQGDPPKRFGSPSATYALDDVFTLFVYPYDVARRLDYSNASWPR